MGASLSQIFNILTEPAGSLIYHLILVFSIAGALQSAFVHWRSSEFPQARRTMFGLGMLLVAQIGLFIVSGIGIQGIVNLAIFLPPLDRAVTLFSPGLADLAMGLPGTQPPRRCGNLAADAARHRGARIESRRVL